MKPGVRYVFEPFQLDVVEQCVWHAQQRIDLTPKNFEVLLYLVEHAGDLASKADLLSAIWPNTYVGDAVLKVAIRELRKVLGDKPSQSKYIETAHRRGYRFIGTVEHISQAPVNVVNPVETPPPSTPLVAREQEMQALLHALERSQTHGIQLVVLSGEAGMGKTTLVQHFLHRAGTQKRWLSAQGQCLEQHGVVEAYMPVLDALGQLCRGDNAPFLVDLLRCHAPTWLVQMPWLVQPSEREALHSELLGATKDRMLREAGVVLEAMTAQTPFILVLEDLQWSDAATLDLITSLSQRHHHAKMVLLMTCRPEDVGDQPFTISQFMQKLKVQTECLHLALGCLTQTQTGQLVNVVLSGGQLPGDWIDAIYQRTEGRPLFIQCVLNYLCEQAQIVQRGDVWQPADKHQPNIETPDTIRALIDRQVQTLDADKRQLLLAASVAGVEFTSTAVACMLQLDVLDVETQCEALVRSQQFIIDLGNIQWPDGVYSGHYRFNHNLYREVLYRGLSGARAQRYHQRIGLRLEQAYAQDQQAVVYELAAHFEQGREYPRAIAYRMQSAQLDMSRYANREAVAQISQALGLLDYLPADARLLAHGDLLEMRSAIYLSCGQLPEAIDDFQMLRTVFAQADPERAIKAQLGLGNALFWQDRRRCLAIGADVLQQSLTVRNPLLAAHIQGWHAHWHAVICGYKSDYANAYRCALDAATAASDERLICQHSALYGYILCLESKYEQARSISLAAMDLAKKQGAGLFFMISRFFHGWALYYLGEWGAMSESLDLAESMAQKNGHAMWVMHFQLQRAWLYLQSNVFAPAEQLAQDVLHKVEARTVASEYYLSMLILGQVYLRTNRIPDAKDIYLTLLEKTQDAEFEIDWVLRLPLYYGLADYFLHAQNWACAQTHVQQLYDCAALSNECTYLLDAQQLWLRLHTQQGDWLACAADLDAGRQLLQEAPYLVGAGAFYRAASVGFEQQGDAAQAAVHQAQSELAYAVLRESMATKANNSQFEVKSIEC